MLWGVRTRISTGLPTSAAVRSRWFGLESFPSCADLQAAGVACACRAGQAAFTGGLESSRVEAECQAVDPVSFRSTCQ
jgi:hypothetical protein